MKVLLVDNYDSFTFNLFHLLEDKVSVEDEPAINEENIVLNTDIKEIQVNRDIRKPNKEITRIEKNIVVARQDEGNDCMRNNIKDIIINFKKSRLREPTNSEIMDELDINDLDKETSVEMINTTKQNMKLCYYSQKFKC